MGLDYSGLMYAPVYDVLARQILVTPLVSAPTAGSYDVRGIYDTDEVDIVGLDGNSIISDQKTELYVLEDDFINAGLATPLAGDRIDIPADGSVRARGAFEVVDVVNSGGGEMTLTIQKLVSPAP
jgi:hypothetical protein